MSDKDEGGSYLIDKDGKRTRVEAPTQDHPEGNRPRAADGTPIDLTPRPAAPEEKPAEPPPETTPRRPRAVPAIAGASGD